MYLQLTNYGCLQLIYYVPNGFQYLYRGDQCTEYYGSCPQNDVILIVH